MNGTQPDLENWNDFLGRFFKVDHVKTWPAVVVVVGVEGTFDGESKAHLIYDVEYLTRKYKWEANVTNTQIIKEKIPTGPNHLIGKKLHFRQVMNFNPQLKKKVPSLEIEKIE